METEPRSELQRAQRALDAAKVLRDAKLLEDSLSRCYYAILHSARAALISRGITVKSHDAAKRLFGQHLVRPGQIEKRYAAILRRQQDDRALADYDAQFHPSAEQVDTRIEEAEDFIDEMKRLVEHNE